MEIEILKQPFSLLTCFLNQLQHNLLNQIGRPDLSRVLPSHKHYLLLLLRPHRFIRDDNVGDLVTSNCRTYAFHFPTKVVLCRNRLESVESSDQFGITIGRIRRNSYIIIGIIKLQSKLESVKCRTSFIFEIGGRVRNVCAIPVPSLTILFVFLEREN